MSVVQQIMASLGTVASINTYATWNPADKSAGSTLTNGNLTYSTATNGQAARATVGKSSGKWYFEMTVSGMGTENNVSGVGVSDSTDALNRGPGWHSVDANRCSIGFSNTGDILKSGAVQFSSTAWSNGDVIGVAFDVTAKTVQFYRNGTAVSSAYSWVTTSTVFPRIGHSASNAFTGTANFGASAFAHPVPSGFNPGVYN